ncbi:MAG: xanthine dehydrogenase family protein molybdopterin-binding subunit [Actinomycetota bacterium]
MDHGATSDHSADPTSASGATIGQPLLRFEDRDLVRGRASYLADLPLPAGMSHLHAVFVRSVEAHATLVAIDTSEATDAPGVAAVFTAADVDTVPAGRFAKPIPACFAQPLLAEHRVRYVGEPVAVVVARSVTEATDAAELVVVETDPLPVMLDLDEARHGGNQLFPPGTWARVQHPDPPETAIRDSGAVLDTGWRGDDMDDARFAAADHLVQLRVVNPRQTPAPIEPRAQVSWWEGDHLHVCATTQRPHGFRDELVALYQLDPASVTVEAAPNVGGGFGGKTSRTPEERVLPHLARATGAAISWVETRTENQLGALQGRGEEITYELAGSADGTIEALRIELVKDSGAYPMTGAVLPLGYAVPNASGPYDIAHVEIRAISVATNRVPTSAYRGAGRAPTVAGLERLIDVFAATIGKDPAEVRRQNLLPPEALPGFNRTGARYDEADYPRDLELLLAATDYAGLRAEQERRRQADAVVQLGLGLATFNLITVGGGAEEAGVTLLPDGRFLVVTGTTDQGHGHRTTWAQVAADVLGVPVHHIEVREGSTALTASGVGAVGSRSAQTAGSAIHRSSTELVARARAEAAALLEAAEADIVLDLARGHFHVIGTPARTVGWAAIADAVAGEERELSCGDVFDIGGNNSYPSGAHLAVVEVDTETAGVRVVRYVAVDDVGVRLNPLVVEGQLHGGIAAGLGQTLGEVIVDDDRGTPLTATFMDYALPTTDVVPPIELIASGTPTSFNPLGVKGVGENGPVGSTPAVHNAIVDALAPFGVRHLDLPCTPDRIWAAISG